MYLTKVFELELLSYILFKSYIGNSEFEENIIAVKKYFVTILIVRSTFIGERYYEVLTKCVKFSFVSKSYEKIPMRFSPLGNFAGSSLRRVLMFTMTTIAVK